MKKLTQYIGIGILCLAGAIAGCKEQKEELEVLERPPIVEIIKNVQTSEEYELRYTLTNGKLRSSLNEYVEQHQDNCIARYSGSIPGSIVTCIYQKERRISVQFINSNRVTSTIEDSLDSKDIQEYKLRFEKDKGLLKEAGLFF